MEELDIAQLVELADSNQIEKATEIVSNYLDNLSSAEKGKAYVDIATAYLHLVAENQEQLAAVLDAQLIQLKQLDLAEKELTEEVELDEVRSQLK